MPQRGFAPARRARKTTTTNGIDVMDHILLSSEEQPQAATRTTQRRFVQAAEVKGLRASYEIFNEHYLEIRVRRLLAKPSAYRVDLRFLDAAPVRRRIVDWPLFGAALGLLVAATLPAVYLWYWSRLILGSPWLPALILTGAGAWVVALFGLYRSSDKLLFYSRHGRIPLVELLNNKPRRGEFEDFLRDLVRHIRLAEEMDGANPRARLAAELREHRRLKDEAVIDASAYEAVKARILHHHTVS